MHCEFLIYTYLVLTFYVNTICLTTNSRFYFCAGVSLNIHSFIRIECIVNSNFSFIPSASAVVDKQYTACRSIILRRDCITDRLVQSRSLLSDTRTQSNDTRTQSNDSHTTDFDTCPTKKLSSVILLSYLYPSDTEFSSEIFSRSALFCRISQERAWNIIMLKSILR